MDEYKSFWNYLKNKKCSTWDYLRIPFLATGLPCISWGISTGNLFFTTYISIVGLLIGREVYKDLKEEYWFKKDLAEGRIKINPKYLEEKVKNGN